MSSTKLPQQFPFETSNGEHYWAQHPNAHYQKADADAFKGLTFAEQSKLPSLPVPDLKSTMAKYLHSIKPYCHNATEWENQSLLSKDFLENMGPVLQSRLETFAKDKRNWLSSFWDNQAYLQYNDPIIPYVSYFYVHDKLPTTHLQIERDPLLKSTAIISTVVKFIESLKREAIPAEIIKESPFCMNSFQLMFNTARIPGNPQDDRDTNIFYSIYENNFMVVAFRGQFYKLSTHSEDNVPLPLNAIWKQLYSIVNDSSAAPATQGIGSLTSLPRDQWRTAHAELIKDPSSRESLELIHRASFILCLDTQVKPITLEEKSRNAWHGDGINRFYDKSLQFFVTGNGSSSFLAEHSKMDGTPTLFLNTYVCQQMAKLNPEQFIKGTLSPSTAFESTTKPLPFLITPTIKSQIESAQNQFQVQINQHDLKVWHYNRYGKNFIKSHGMSPDAFIQQVIQLAIYKYLGRQLPTYEAASTRKYFKGRTEAGRSVSPASQAFVQSWDSPTKSTVEKIALLKLSAKEHSNYMKDAANGMAIDRHLFGLKNMLQPEDVKPELFKDPTFNYSSTWLVSTSQLSSEYFEGYGWSEVNDNGVGLAYMLNKDWLHINIVCKPEFSLFNVQKMHYYLSEAADEIADALIQVEKQAKL